MRKKKQQRQRDVGIALSRGVPSSRQVQQAARRVRAAADASAGVRSWRALNMQVRWAIQDLVACSGYTSSMAMVMRMMEDGTEAFWQRFWMLPEHKQKAAVHAAARKLR